ncbi:AsmA-like C-terminal domain-containing protein [Thermosulfurimonas sp. F29]|uniref:YhdP family protein n=1 Tax=Thermosulfurimonas sp. F29 TaxID=2867247 RepID=UPI001C83A9CA|nr:AsmA-like C-terminal domain-containing protein [Thermosulfurimonas sp. F29]MBX6423684.1 AsmA-like C-terminal domain-containing protein [Thermosulfurimonas sp. F29]
MKRALKISALVLAGFLLLAVALGFLLPYIVNLSAVKDRVAQRLSRTLKAEVSVGTLRFRVFLRPGLSAEEVRIRAPSYLLSVRSLRLYPEVIPLLHRKIVIRSFALESPHLTVILPESRGKRPLSVREIVRRLPVLPAMEVRVSGGRLRLLRGEVFLLELTDLSAEVATRPEQILVELKGTPSFARSLRLKGRLNLKEASAEGLLELSRVDLAALRLLKDYLPLPVRKTDFSLSLAYTYEDGSLVAGFKGSAPCVLFEKEPDLLFSCAAFEGQFSVSKAGFEVLFRNLDFKEPELRGELTLRKQSGAYELAARLSSLDFTAVRERLLRIFPKNKGLAHLFSTVRGGVFSDLEFRSRAPELSGLFRPENFILSARVREGAVRLSRPALDLSGVSGTLSLIMGDLTFKGSARLPELTVNKASVRVHLRDRKAPLRVAAGFSGESARLLSVARSVSPRVERALSFLAVRGPVSGSLEVSGSREKPRVRVRLRPERISLRMNALPWPLTVSGGTFSLRGKKLSLSGSRISGPPGSLRISLDLDFSRRPYRIRLSEARGRVILKPLLPLLFRSAEIKRLWESLRLSVKEVEIASLTYQGPLTGKALRAGVRFQGKVLAGSLFVKALGIPLQFRGLPLTYRPGHLGFGPGEFEVLGAGLVLSGTKDLRTGTLSLRGSGEVSRNLLVHLYERLHLPQRFLLTSPLRLKNLDLSLPGKGRLRLTLSLETSRGAALEATLERDENGFVVRDGRLLFREETLTFSFEKVPMEYRVNLKGELSPRVLTALFEENPGLRGYFRADFETDFNLSHPLLSRFRGRLEGEGLILPVRGSPRVERFRLRGAGRVFHFEELVARVGRSDFTATGRLEVAPGNFLIEGNLVSDFLDLPYLKQTLFLRKKKTSPRLRVAGHMTLRCHRLRLSENKFLEDFEGEIFLYAPGGRVVISRARFCGLPLEGDYRFGRRKQLNLNIYEPRGNFEVLWSCLSPGQKVFITGPFSLRTEIHLGGSRNLFEEGRGTFSLYSPSGEIRRFGLLAKILGFLSPIDLFKGQIPSMEKSGFPYQKLSVKGKLSGSRFHVESAHLDGPGLRLFASGDVFLPEGRLDLTVLASPFKTVDTLVSRIPVVGFVLTGKKKMLVSFPIGIRGTYKDPTILPLDPKAIGEGVFNIFRRVFELPAHVVIPKK